MLLISRRIQGLAKKSWRKNRVFNWPLTLNAITLNVLECENMWGELKMIASLNILPIDEKIQLVEDLWDSIAEEKSVLPITKEQKNELNFRLEAYALDGNKGREAEIVFADIRSKLWVIR